MSRTRLALVAVLLASCTADPTVVYVTIGARPAQRPVASLGVVVANGGGSRSQEFAIPPGQGFPVSFSVTPTGRAGALTVEVVARDGEGVAVGRITGASPIVAADQADLALTLEPDDYGVNDEVVGSQHLTETDDHAGRQVAAGPNSNFLIVWGNGCPDARCDVVGRLYGPDTVARPNEISKTTDEFRINRSTAAADGPAVAGGEVGYLVAWVATAAGGATTEIHATALTADGAHVASEETRVSTSPRGDAVPSVFAAGTGFVVVWQTARDAGAGNEIRARRFDDRGGAVTNGVTGDDGDFAVSASATSAQQPHGAALADGGFVIAWSQAEESGFASGVWARAYASDGRPQGAPFAVAVPVVGSASTPHVLGTSDGGFWIGFRADQPGDPVQATRPLLARRYDHAARPVGEPLTLVAATDDPGAVPALARTAGGLLAVAWHDCPVAAHAACDVHLRLFHASGLPLGAAFVPTLTIAGDQRSPSLLTLGEGVFLTAWTDSSGVSDSDGTGVRARAVYVDTERRDGAIGARCGDPADASCDAATTCVTDADGVLLCHPRCDAAAATPCLGGGTCQDGACRY